MGQKVNPIGLRLGIVKTWDSKWYAGKNYAEYIYEDHKIRKFIKKKLFHAGISRIEIERSARRVRLRIFTARPGIVIGKKGSEIELLKKELENLISQEVLIDIQEVRKPEIDAQLVAENVALQIERRVAFRRAMKRGVSSAMRFGAQGVKIICSGRLGGAEMARTDKMANSVFIRFPSALERVTEMAKGRKPSRSQQAPITCLGGMVCAYPVQRVI